MNQGGFIPVGCVRNELSDRIIVPGSLILHLKTNLTFSCFATACFNSRPLFSGSTKNVHLTVPSKATLFKGFLYRIMGGNAPPEPGYHHILQLLNLKLARRALAESFGAAARLLPFNVIPGRNRNTSPTSARSQLPISVIKNENKIAGLSTRPSLSSQRRPPKRFLSRRSTNSAKVNLVGYFHQHESFLSRLLFHQQLKYYMAHKSFFHVYVNVPFAS